MTMTPPWTADAVDPAQPAQRRTHVPAWAEILLVIATFWIVGEIPWIEYTGPVALIASVLVITVLLRRRGTGWSSLGLRGPQTARNALQGAGMVVLVYLGAATMLVPLAWMVLTALKSESEAALAPTWSTLLPSSPRWGNFLEAVRAADLDRFYLNSTIAAVVTTVLAVSHNALAGYAFAKLRFAGKRVLFGLTLAPMMVLKDGAPRFALGLPGALRIFPSAMQAIVNLIDFGMSPQQAVEAPRIWTEGAHVELEPDYAHHRAALEAKGHDVQIVPHIGGGMNAIAFDPDGAMTGAACWRADGTVSAMGGGLADAGVSFHI